MTAPQHSRRPPPEVFRRWSTSTFAVKIPTIFIVPSDQPDEVLIYFSPLHELGRQYTTRQVNYYGQQITIGVTSRTQLIAMFHAYKKTVLVLMWNHDKQDFEHIKNLQDLKP